VLVTCRTSQAVD